MRTKFFFLFVCLALLATSCATQKSSPPTPLQAERGAEQAPVYYDGNDDPAAFAVGGQQSQ
jgi:hypothetical protein